MGDIDRIEREWAAAVLVQAAHEMLRLARVPWVIRAALEAT